jgi:hypothetical protein
MRVWNVEDLALWTCEYIDIKNMNNSKIVQLVNYLIYINKITVCFPNIQLSNWCRFTKSQSIVSIIY